ncbi:YaiI/YqxD family protein [Thomasclavelia saccharogumia]|uniref:YaiI/YqxD family protein n=1 Tax=Thomasclavelia saccharogumia TaxID=341225 RepID=UPI00047AEDE3|nr:DUF188 domain-containing protein [Thomasclavelia saccharogumia]
MAILVDGDACPDLLEIKKLAKRYLVEMIVFVDYAHCLQDDYFKVCFCEVGKDSVDQAIINTCKKGDLVISQDYGLASYALLKGTQVLHPSRKVINNENIDQLLMGRYVSAKQRRMNKRVKGPAKRTEKIHDIFLRQLENILINNKNASSK